jgi:pyruvate formate-lyase activating enzyme-like uncharacterized protein
VTREVAIPDDLKDRHTLLKCWTDAGKHPKTEHNTFEFAKEIVALIERIARLEQQLANARKEALTEARDATCRGCQTGLETVQYVKGLCHKGWTYCQAENIRALIAKETQK